MPVRIQRLNSPGWKPPVAAKYVGRPTFFGNPFTHLQTPTTADIVVANRQSAVDFYEAMVLGDPDGILGMALDTPEQVQNITARGAWIRAHLDELRGKDLICWCRPDEACHADALLRLANP